MNRFCHSRSLKRAALALAGRNRQAFDERDDALGARARQFNFAPPIRPSNLLFGLSSPPALSAARAFGSRPEPVAERRHDLRLLIDDLDPWARHAISRRAHLTPRGWTPYRPKPPPPPCGAPTRWRNMAQDEAVQRRVGRRRHRRLDQFHATPWRQDGGGQRQTGAPWRMVRMDEQPACPDCPSGAELRAVQDAARVGPWSAPGGWSKNHPKLAAFNVNFGGRSGARAALRFRPALPCGGVRSVDRRPLMQTPRAPPQGASQRVRDAGRHDTPSPPCCGLWCVLLGLNDGVFDLTGQGRFQGWLGSSGLPCASQPMTMPRRSSR